MSLGRVAAIARWVGVCVAGAGAWFLLRVSTNQFARSGTWWLSPDWLVLFVVTPVIFGVLLRYFRPSWRSSRFRLVVACLMIAHLIGHGVLITAVENWKFIWTVVLSGAEGPAMVALLLMLGFEAEESE